MSTVDSLGAEAEARLLTLGRLSDDPLVLNRPSFGRAHRDAAALVSAWFAEAGLDTRINTVGTIIGRSPGAHERTLLIGSHIDTVPDAGAYDGVLGVVVAALALRELRLRGVVLPFGVELLAFGDEEGLRYPATSIGSLSVARPLPDALLDVVDATGTPLRRAIADFTGTEPQTLAGLAYDPDSLLGYLEVHVEQGPILEAEEKPLGVVIGISGATRLRVVVTGRAGHAGTVPHRMRRDALTAASEMVLAVEQVATASDDTLRATVGDLDVPNGAANAIPGKTTFTVDIRSGDDAVRERAVDRLRRRFDEIADARGVSVAIAVDYDCPAATCDPALSGSFAAAIEELGLPHAELPSGAGHDAQTIAEVAPIAMLFVRCRGGISHAPDEYAAPRDIGLAVEALIRGLTHLAKIHSRKEAVRA